MAQQLAACDTCLLLKPVEEYARGDGLWETACLACRTSGAPAAKRARMSPPANGHDPQAGGRGPAGREGDDGAAADAPASQLEAVLSLELFRGALEAASPDAARRLMQQLLDAHGSGRLAGETVADVALAYLAQHAQQQPPAGAAGEPPAAPASSPRPEAATARPQPQFQQPGGMPAMGGPGGLPGPPPPHLAAPGPPLVMGPPLLMGPGPIGAAAGAAGPPPIAQQQQHQQGQEPREQQQAGQDGVPPPQQQQQMDPWRQRQQAAIDAVPPRMLRLILEQPQERFRRRLCALARRCPPLLGQLLCAGHPGSLLADGQLSPEDLLGALGPRQPGTPRLPALAAVTAASALLAAAPPSPSPELLRLVQLLAEGHWLMAIVEVGHLKPADLRGALQAAPPEAFTKIFKAMCSSDGAGQSFLKQAMQRAMPRADYGELMRISMLAEVAQTAATVTDRATLQCLLDKAFE